MTTDEAFADAYGTHNAMLRRYLLKRVTDKHVVEDLLQETWTKVWRAFTRDGLDGRDRIEPWLIHITRNTLTDHWRRASLRPVVLAGDDAAFAHHAAAQTGPEESAIAAAEWAADLACLQPDHRTVLRMRCELEMSVLETAAALGVPSGTVRSRMHYGRRAVAARRAAS